MGYKKTDKCLQKVAEDEMIFVLRAQDFTAPVAIIEWLKVNINNPNMSDDRLREAFECVVAMRNHKNNRKVPD